MDRDADLDLDESLDPLDEPGSFKFDENADDDPDDRFH